MSRIKNDQILKMRVKHCIMIFAPYKGIRVSQSEILICEIFNVA